MHGYNQKSEPDPDTVTTNDNLRYVPCNSLMCCSNLIVHGATMLVSCNLYSFIVACEDGLKCTLNDHCDGAGQCTAATPKMAAASPTHAEQDIVMPTAEVANVCPQPAIC